MDKRARVRKDARCRRSLDGTDAKDLEHALTVTERERAEAEARLWRILPDSPGNDPHAIVGETYIAAYERLCKKVDRLLGQREDLRSNIEAVLRGGHTSAADLAADILATLAAKEQVVPIPCKGHWIRSIEGDDYDCGYPHPPGCEDCIVNGGEIDPRVKEEED